MLSRILALLTKKAVKRLCLLLLSSNMLALRSVSVLLALEGSFLKVVQFLVFRTFTESVQMFHMTAWMSLGKESSTLTIARRFVKEATPLQSQLSSCRY